MGTVLIVRRWSQHFETSESRKRVGALAWIAVPTKHDGRSYRRVTREKNGVAALCGWWALLQVAAKMPVRGVLADHDGPLEAEDLAEKTNLPVSAFKSTLEIMLRPEIGWLQRAEWDEKLDFSTNCRNLPESAGITAESSRPQQTPADGKSVKRGRSSEVRVPEPQQTPADRSRQQQIAADASRQQHEPAGRAATDRQTDRQTDNPPTVPLAGGQSEIDSVVDFLEAKRIICADILKGKNPDRPWSYEATQELARLLPIPRKEFRLIAWFHSLADDGQTPALRDRRRSETTLVRFWSDEVTRAAAYREKIGAGLHARKKAAEPELWREFFRWKYGDQVVLPSRFDQLGGDQRKEWEVGHDAFEAARKEEVTA